MSDKLIRAMVSQILETRNYHLSDKKTTQLSNMLITILNQKIFKIYPARITCSYLIYG